MAILNKYLIASTIFSAVALAAPLVPRNTITDLVIDVITETVWTTVDFTTTTYDEAPTAAVEVPTTSAPAVVTTSAVQMTPDAQPTSTPTTTVPMTTSSSAAAPQFFTTSTTSAAASAAGLAQAATSTSTSAAAASSPAASANVVASSISASETGTCKGDGMACVGDVTYWTGGLGACGTNVDTNNDLAIALPFQFMGTLSNTNPYCGRSVTLYNPFSGTTVQATVMDKCMGCYNRSIDCTELLFNQITDNEGNGRMSGIDWWLN